MRSEPTAGGPAILLVSGDAAKTYVIEQTLLERGATARSASHDELEASASAFAPDLIAVLDGPEARSAIDALLSYAVAPIAWVGGAGAPGIPPSVAMIAAALGTDALVTALVELASQPADSAPAREIEGSAEARLTYGLSTAQRGLLAVRSASGLGQAFVTGPGCAPGILIALPLLAARMAARGDEVEVSFHVGARGRVQSIEEPTGIPDDVAPSMDGVRVLLLGPRTRLTHALSDGLEHAGARVAVVDGGGSGLGRARTLAPDVIVADVDTLAETTSASLRAIAGDVRLTWAARLVVPASAAPPSADVVARGVASLLAPDRALREQAVAGAPFHARLEWTGPLRLLRALAATQLDLLLDVRHPSVHVEIELGPGVIAGARAKGAAGELAEGHVAIATLLALTSGRVHVSPRVDARLLDVMRPLDEVLAVALEQRPIGAPRQAQRAPIEVPRATLSASALVELVAERAAPETKPERAETLAATVPPPKRAAPEPEAEAEAEASADAPIEHAEPIDAPVSAPDESPTPPPAARTAARPARGLVGAMLVILVTASALALGPGLWADEDPPAAPAPTDALEASFDAVDEEAEADVPREEAAEDEHAREVHQAPPAPSTAATPMVLDGASVDAMILHGHLAWRRGDLVTAHRYYTDILHSDPTNARALVGLVRVARTRGDLIEATRVARQLRDTHSDHPANHVLLGDLLMLQGDAAGAWDTYYAASRQFPNNVPARERLHAMRHRP